MRIQNISDDTENVKYFGVIMWYKELEIDTYSKKNIGITLD